MNIAEDVPPTLVRFYEGNFCYVLLYICIVCRILYVCYKLIADCREGRQGERGEEYVFDYAEKLC